MFKRPKPGEDEEDILRMQEEFLREKNKNANLQPAALVTNLRRIESSKRPSTSDASIRKISKYAQSKGLKNQSEKHVCIDTSTISVMGDILEKNIEESSKNCTSVDEDDKVYYPKVIPAILGNILEKNMDSSIDFQPQFIPSSGFPPITKWHPFSSASNTQPTNASEIAEEIVSNMDLDKLSASTVNIVDNKNTSKRLPHKSYILSSNDAHDIHNENIQTLSKLSEIEILQERQKLLSDLDPKLIEFIKAKREKSSAEKPISATTELRTNEEKMDINDSYDPSKDSSVDVDALWENDVLSHPDINKWLHFDSFEKDKMEWMKGINESKTLKPDQPYEARFNFNGYLLPYALEYTENAKSLFHHGDEPHRPGYSLSELFDLSRSAVPQQRVLALNIIAGILEYYSAGTYKDIIEIPMSKIFFIIRFAIDENKAILLEPALKAMRNLIYNRIDEASLDALIGFEEGINQPWLKNDNSEIEELESEESDLKDFHLAEIDIITALLRTDILQRLYYILEAVKPSFNCVQYSLQILIRLVRDSADSAQKIVETDHLMKTITNHFIPISSLSFAFIPQIVYNKKPILAALKLLRILSLQSREIGIILIDNYDILKPVSEYISSGVDSTYGLRIQIESYCILSNLLQYKLGIENAVSLSPVVITTLYKHVQGTDVFKKSSIVSVTHGAVVLQFINKLLNCYTMNLDRFKHQVYPLLKEGVQKWIAQLSNSESYTCGHLRLVCSALDCCKTVLFIERVPIKFLIDSLRQMSSSKGFKEIVKNLIPSSNLLSNLENKDLHFTKNLKSLGTSVIDSAQKVLPILHVMSPLPFLASLLNLLRLMEDKDLCQDIIDQFSMYLRSFTNKSPCLCDNWFTRLETNFLFSLVKISVMNNISDENKDLLYAVSNKLCYILRIDKKYELEFLLNSVVFNKKWFTADRLFNLMSLSDTESFSKALQSIGDIKLCYRKVINIIVYTGMQIWQEPILPRDWIYLPILMLYSRSQKAEPYPPVGEELDSQMTKQAALQKELNVACNLEWILFNELCFPDLLQDIKITDRLCRIMCVFLCDNSLFLNDKIKILLQKCIQTLFKKKASFDFDMQLTGINNFQDFYTQLLEQFQSVSYGDLTFAVCVLVPIAQHHNVKWRKLLWSEYAGCLRALDCPEEMLCYEIKDYLYPEETDESLIKSYLQALSSNLLRRNTIAYKIASHHVISYKNRKNTLS